MVPIRKFILLMLVFALSLTVFAGCAAEEPAPAGPSQRLLISGELVEEMIDPATNQINEFYGYPITVEEMGGNYSTNIGCHQLKDLTITLNGKEYPLAEAIRDQHITVEEICAYARIDARNGFCSELATSDKGLSYFHYIYSDFQISIRHDIYETPDGKQHTINSIDIYPPYGHENSTYSFSNPDSPYPYKERLDREEWGLTFEVTAASPSGLELKTTQSQGQQIGQLQVQSFELYSIDRQEFIQANDSATTDTFPKIDITMSDETEFNIDWSAIYPELMPGNYYIVFWVKDTLIPGFSHPLLVDYYTTQEYFVEFTIP